MKASPKILIQLDTENKYKIEEFKKRLLDETGILFISKGVKIINLTTGEILC